MRKRQTAGLVLGGALALTALTGCRPTAVWSPDSRQIALDAGGVIQTFDVQTHQFQRRTQGPRYAFNPAWSPDGKQLGYLLATFKSDINTLALASTDPATGAQRLLIPKLPVPPDEGGQPPQPHAMLDLARESLNFTWSPDGKHLALTVPSGHEYTVMTANADGTNLRRLIPGEGFSPAWSPDSTRLAFVDTDALEIAAPDGSGRKALWNFQQRGKNAGRINGVRWSPDGKSLRVLFDDDPKKPDSLPEACTLWSVPVDGSEPKQLAAVPGPGILATLSAGGESVTFLRNPGQDAKEALVAILQEPFQQPISGGVLTEKMAGTIQPGDDSVKVDRIPMPVLSPDGKLVATPILPEKGPGTLVLTSVGGGEAQQYRIPRLAPAPSAPPQKAKPAAKRPAKKR